MYGTNVGWHFGTRLRQRDLVQMPAADGEPEESFSADTSVPCVGDRPAPTKNAFDVS